MMSQVRGHMDVASEPLGNFDWSLIPVLNACNFAGALWYFGLQRFKEDKAAHWHPCPTFYQGMGEWRPTTYLGRKAATPN
ncbi:MAG: hypothetical protein COB74_09815 [Shewanella sp.]|nr:MAG: hypothetical protein COB74_09815 [Shewanella sp.]